MNEHAFLPGDLARVKITPCRRIWTRLGPTRDAGGFYVSLGTVVIVVHCQNNDDACSYVIVDGKHAFMKTAMLEPA